MNVIPCVPVSPMFLTGLLKTPVCKFLVSSSRVSELPGKVWQKNRPKNSYLRVLRFCFRVSPSVFFFVVPHGSPRPAQIPPPPATSYPDDARCAFYDTSLNTACRVLSSEDGPWEDFAAFVEWTLVRNGSPLTVCPEDNLARSTPDPVPSPPSHRCADRLPEPTADGEPEYAKTSPHGATVLRIAVEPEPEPLMTSVKVREPATEPATWENAADSESACRGQWERGEELRPLHRGWGWADYTAGTAGHGGGGGGDLIDWETDLEIELALSSLRHPRWFRPALIRLWFPFPALRRLPILQYPLLKDALQCPLLENARPPTHSCLLHRCFLAAPLLALSPPSMRCELGGTVILQHRRGQSFPWLRLQPPRPGLHLGTLTHRLHHGS